MGSIYKTAKNVIVWLGQEDEFTQDALKMVNILSRIPKERHPEVQLADWYQQELTLARFGLFEPITPYLWCGLVGLLNRPWFSRAWVAQEVILAQNAVVVCGQNVLPWSLLSNTIAFLTTTGWHDQISSGQMRTVPTLMMNPRQYRKLLESNAHVGMAAIYLESTRTGIANLGHKAVFRYLIDAHRYCEATDPRDMTYAFLGLAWRERLPFTTHPDAIVPDYKISVQDLYSRWLKPCYSHTKTCAS